MSEESTSLAVAESTDMMWSAPGFDHAQRLAKMFAQSELIPPHLRGKTADVCIALLMAKRMHEDPLMIMQSMYSVQGRAGWSAQFYIAKANSSGVFKGRINWREVVGPKFKYTRSFKDRDKNWKTETVETPDYQVTAYATLADVGEEVSFTASMQMAAAEDWTNNAKYKTMPLLMLRYRSATLLVRLFAPEIMLGIPTSDELEDVTAATVVHSRTSTPHDAGSDEPDWEIAASAPSSPDAAPSTPTAQTPAAASVASPAPVTAAASASSAPPAGDGGRSVPPPRDTERADLARECSALEAQCRTIPALVGLGGEIRESLSVPAVGPVSGKWARETLLRYRTGLQSEISRALASQAGAPNSADRAAEAAESGGAAISQCPPTREPGDDSDEDFSEYGEEVQP